MSITMVISVTIVMSVTIMDIHSVEHFPEHRNISPNINKQLAAPFKGLVQEGATKMFSYITRKIIL
jgi:hypothetical protein